MKIIRITNSTIKNALITDELLEDDLGKPAEADFYDSISS